MVQRAQASIDDDDDEPRFVLQRAPGQPPLSPLAGGNRLSEVIDQEPSTLSMCGELGARAASTELPAAAEALLHGEQHRLSVSQALEQLRGARDGLLAALQPGEAYLLARRSVLNQVRLRSAIELLHALSVLGFLGHETSNSVEVCTDSKAAYDLCHRYTSAQNSRHVDRKLFKMRELRGAGVVTVRHIPGDSNPADLFTKILTRQPFEKHRKFVLNLPGNSGVDQTRAAAAWNASSPRDGTGAP